MLRVWLLIFWIGALVVGLLGCCALRCDVVIWIIAFMLFALCFWIVYVYGLVFNSVDISLFYGVWCLWLVGMLAVLRVVVWVSGGGTCVCGVVYCLV